VELFNKLNLADKKPANLKIAAATAAAGNGWGSGDTDSTVASVRKAVLADYIPEGINDVLDVAM
jgi:hypothetical protein